MVLVESGLGWVESSPWRFGLVLVEFGLVLVEFGLIV